MDNERVVLRATLRLKDGSDSSGVGGVCTETVDGLCWECNDVAGTQKVSCSSEVGGVGSA